MTAENQQSLTRRRKTMVSSLKELLNGSELASSDDPEEKFIISGISWQKYEALLAKLEDNSHYRVTYLDGILEIVSPSIRHENLKKRLAILIERYLYSRRIRFSPMGSSTYCRIFLASVLNNDYFYLFSSPISPNI